MRYLILLILLTACATHNDNLPDWYIKPPANNANYIYGAGYGYDLDNAKKSALNAAAEKLKITISSNFDL